MPTLGIRGKSDTNFGGRGVKLVVTILQPVNSIQPGDGW
jgi:hypothetical protein